MDSQLMDKLVVLTEDEEKEMLRLKDEDRLPKVIDRSLDLFFRFLLAFPARIALLQDLVNCVFVALGRARIVKLELCGTELAPHFQGNKLSRLDISATDERGRLLNIELQRQYHSGFVSRGLIYLDKLFVSQIGASEDYDVLKPTIAINLLAFNLFGDEDRAVWDFLWMNPATKRILTDVQAIFYVEMIKLQKRLLEVRAKVKADPNYRFTNEERLWVWGGYMTNDEMGVSIVQTTADTVFQRVNDTEKEYWSSFAVRYRQLQEQIAEWDRRAFLKDARNQGLAEGHKQGLEEGRKKGLEQGLEEGRKKGLEQGLEQGLERGRALGEAKGRADVVRQLAASGLLTLEQVAQATGMSTEEVRAITSE